MFENETNETHSDRREGKGRTRVQSQRPRSAIYGSSDESRKVHSDLPQKSQRQQWNARSNLLNKQNFFFFIIKPTQKSRDGRITNFLFILFKTLRKSRKVNSANTCGTRRHSYWIADTLNGPGPSNMAWALKWAGPKKTSARYWWAYTNGPKQHTVKFFFFFFN